MSMGVLPAFVYALYACNVHRGQKRASSGTIITEGCKLPCELWEPSLGPLEEQQVPGLEETIGKINKGPFEWPLNGCMPCRRRSGSFSLRNRQIKWTRKGDGLLRDTQSPVSTKSPGTLTLTTISLRLKSKNLLCKITQLPFASGPRELGSLKMVLVNVDASWLRVTDVMFVIQLQMVPD